MRDPRGRRRDPCRRARARPADGDPERRTLGCRQILDRRNCPRRHTYGLGCGRGGGGDRRAGVRLGDLYDELAEHGLTIPAGCGSSVGIAGLTLGGGLGILGRKHGLTCDHLLRAQVVLADGRVVECDEHHDGELFWALRGAGGGHFGVVTSLVFRTIPAPATTVFHLVWPPAAAAAVVRAWQAYAPEA